MASLARDNTAEECACGMDFKKGTSVYAVVLSVGSVILITICGIELNGVINHKYADVTEEYEAVTMGVLIFSIVLYGLHVVSCGLVILAAKMGNRYLLIPWMVFGSILALSMIRLIYRTIRRLIAAGDDVPRSTSFVDSPAFTILICAVYLILVAGFGRCVGKLFRILRAEKRQPVQQTVNLYPAIQPQPQFAAALPTDLTNALNVVPGQPPRYEEEEAPKTAFSNFRFAPTGYEQMPRTPYGV